METSVRGLRCIILLVGLAVLATACIPFVGDSEDEATPTPDVIPTVIRPGPASTPTTASPASPVPTLVPLPTQAPSTAATAPPACTPRADWPEYTIASGDTLYSLAIRTDTTVAALQAANCLDDPHKIFEGQELRVPTAPAATAAPGATPGAFFPTATPAGVTFTFVIANNSAEKIVEDEHYYQALQDPVHVSIVATGATRFELVRVGDAKVLGTAQASSGSTNSGGTFALRNIDRLEGSDQLLFTVKATTPNGDIVESGLVLVSWP